MYLISDFVGEIIPFEISPVFRAFGEIFPSLDNPSLDNPTLDHPTLDDPILDIPEPLVRYTHY